MRHVTPAPMSVLVARGRLRPPSFYEATTSDTGSDTSTSAAKTVSVVASATPHTKGSWVELISSTSASATQLLLVVTGIAFIGQSATDTSTLLDVGVGGAGSESVIIPNITLGGLGGGFWTFPFDVYIPAGSRVALRSQAVIDTRPPTMAVKLRTLPHRVRPASTVTTFGANTAASQGTTVTNSGTNHTKGSWTVIGTATERIGAIIPSIGLAGDTTMASAGGLVDIGYDNGGGTVTVIEPDIALQLLSTETFNYYVEPQLTACDVPAGCRFLARFQSGNAANNAAVDVCVHAMPWRA